MIQVKLAALLLLAVEMVGGYPCTVASQTVNCNNRSIVDIPQEFPNNITNLDLDDNIIETIKTRDLRRYTQLRIVRLGNNRIEKVDVEAFAHLTQLRAMNLSDNRLTFVDNTIFINNTKLVELILSGNKLLLDPKSPFLISSSIAHLELKRCGIWLITNVTFSKMKHLKFLSISENRIHRLDSASFYYNSLHELYIECAEEIKSTLIELCRKNVNVYYKISFHSFCEGDWSTETLTTLKFSFTNRKESMISAPKEISSTSATADETVTISMDRILVFVLASLSLITSGLSVIVLILYFRKQKIKTKKDIEDSLHNGDKPNTSAIPESQSMLAVYDQVNDGYEVARRNRLLHLQPDVLPAWPSRNAPQRPLPLPPQQPCSHHSDHEYEKIRECLDFTQSTE